MQLCQTLGKTEDKGIKYKYITFHTHNMKQGSDVLVALLSKQEEEEEGEEFGKNELKLVSIIILVYWLPIKIHFLR